MKITVQDCLKMPSFTDASLLAGESSLNNAVKKVSVLEAQNHKDALKYSSAENQMLLTSFLGVKDNVEEQVKIIESVAKGGNVALVIFNVESVLKKIKKEVVKAAESYSLPLILMSKDSGDTGDVINEITSKIFYGEDEGFGNKLINNTIFHLLNFEKYTNFQAAAKAAALNNDFQLILLSEDFNPIFSVETRYRTTIAEAIRLGKKKSIEKQRDVYTRIDVNGVLTYWGPVTIQNTKYFMFIVDNEDSYSTEGITKLAEIIELAMGMWKYTPERDVRSEFIKALRRGNLSLAYSLRSELETSSEDIISLFYGVGIETSQGEKILEEMDKLEKIELIRVTEDEETFGIIFGNNKEDDIKNHCIDLYNKLKKDKKARMFHVTGIDGIDGATDGYKLISETWNFAQKVFPYKRVFTKYEMVLVSNCINIQLQGGNVKKNFGELLDSFKDIGETKGKQLLETLETFVLDAGMNSSKTAEFMGIHTNTVQYRLKKINELLGVDLTGNRVIPGITIALAIRRLERAAF